MNIQAIDVEALSQDGRKEKQKFVPVDQPAPAPKAPSRTTLDRWNEVLSGLYRWDEPLSPQVCAVVQAFVSNLNSSLLDEPYPSTASENYAKEFLHGLCSPIDGCTQLATQYLAAVEKSRERIITELEALGRVPNPEKPPVDRGFELTVRLVAKALTPLLKELDGLRAEVRALDAQRREAATMPWWRRILA